MTEKETWTTEVRQENSENVPLNMKGLDVFKSPELEGLHPRVMKELAGVIAGTLARI